MFSKKRLLRWEKEKFLRKKVFFLKKVNEEGTEAAAATTYPYTPTSHPVEEETFLADHPFTFMLMKNSEILFCGIFQG